MQNISELIRLLHSDKFQKISSEDESKILNEIKSFIENDVVSDIDDLESLKKDVQNLENSQHDLVRSRNILRSLFDNLPDIVYVIDKDYRIDAVNMALSRKIDKPPQTLVGKVCYKAFYRLNHACQGCLMIDTMQKGFVTTRNKQVRINNKEFSDWEINTYPIYDEKGEVSQVILVERDVTDRHRMEMLVTQSEKMSAVGQLAAGFAHEINNPLSVIMANAQILMREMPEGYDWRELLLRIQLAGGRALEIVNNLLDFAHWENVDLQPTDINDTIQKSLSLIRHVSKDHKTEIIFNPGQNLPQISASSGSLQSVWVNLILNSLDAVEPGNGKIEIDSEYENNEIIVRISDNGRGISKHNIIRIFDPFYTTKDPGKGTGLGLSICHRIIKQHGGLIEVDSVEGEGSVFTIHLPDFLPEEHAPR